MRPAKATILLLDDSEVCLEVTAEALESEGYRVITGKSALGASRLVHHGKPDCVVVDVTMPALRGDRLVEILRRSAAPDVPILLHSDRPWGELVALAKSCGATGAVMKTPDCRTLLHEVRQQLRARAP